ncbi:MAG TPA: flagellar hook-basal body complex protein FliE [Candidatus Acidoferrales bacterium]|jgi:flagellar hook-basal body complex protein FliE|nr:flagellar hook-basal body complex protein FliE [Candidatus Acidoferrales bacterium]
MSPIPAITPAAAGVLPNAGIMTPDATPLRSTGIQMPEELSDPMGTSAAQPTSDSFSSMLGKMVSDVSAQQNMSAQAVGALQSGQNIPLHQAVIAMEEANISFQLMVEVRNRMLDAYQEVMRMQV